MILAGDIGGTNARLALFDGPKGRPIAQAAFKSAAYGSLEAVVREFLGGRARDGAPAARPQRGLHQKVKVATFGVAGPVIDQRCVATNLPWVIDARVVSRKLGIPRVTLLNDLVALAYGALTVPASKLRRLQGASLPKKTGANLAMIAAGTGLGEAALVWDGTAHVPLATEGGHTDFAARTPLEWELHVWLEKRFGHVSYERIVAGPGFSTLYDFFCEAKGVREGRDSAEQIASATDRNVAIVDLGLAGASEPAARAVDLFVRLYGAEAGNLALKTMPTGGLFVGGGIAAKIADRLAAGPFLEAFADKGRFRAVLEKIPVAIVLDSQIGLAGSRLHAARKLR